MTSISSATSTGASALETWQQYLQKLQQQQQAQTDDPTTTDPTQAATNEAVKGHKHHHGGGGAQQAQKAADPLSQIFGPNEPDDTDGIDVLV